MSPFVRFALPALLCFGGCGSETGSPLTATPGQVLESIEARPGQRQIVAMVQERPIYGDCVQRQAQGHNLTAQEAVEECIDFELLAIEAERAGLMASSEVQHQGRTEMVRSFVAGEYPLRTAKDLPDEAVSRLWDTLRDRYFNHPALREMSHCRVELSPEQGPESAEYQAANALFSAVYEDLKDQPYVSQTMLFEKCFVDEDTAKTNGVTLFTAPMNSKARFDPVFGEVLFGDNQAGDILPPLHSRYGWDLMVVTRAKQKRVTSFIEAEQELRQRLFHDAALELQREQLFLNWYEPLAAQHQTRVHYDRLPRPTMVQGADTNEQVTP